MYQSLMHCLASITSNGTGNIYLHKVCSNKYVIYTFTHIAICTCTYTYQSSWHDLACIMSHCTRIICIHISLVIYTHTCIGIQTYTYIPQTSWHCVARIMLHGRGNIHASSVGRPSVNNSTKINILKKQFWFTSNRAVYTC